MLKYVSVKRYERDLILKGGGMRALSSHNTEHFSYGARRTLEDLKQYNKSQGGCCAGESGVSLVWEKH